MRDDPKEIVFGLQELADPGWQSFLGMLKTPFVGPSLATHSLAATDGADAGSLDEDRRRLSRLEADSPSP
jgi:hypothetical protein